MQIDIGYDFTYDLPQPTPMLLTVHVHYSRVSDLVVPDHLITSPRTNIAGYRDSFGNWISRIVAPAGRVRLSAHAVINDTGHADPVHPHARQHAVQELPEETLIFLLGSRYCETDRLSDIAWKLFEHAPTGWGRVQAICDFVHNHIKFGYEFARPTKTALEAYQERAGVCRDFAHLAVAFCRCMNIPARYCTGYLPDIGIPPVDAPMDFSGWFEALPRRPVARVRRALQHAADRPHPDGARPRRRRRRDRDHVRRRTRWRTSPSRRTRWSRRGRERHPRV